MKNGISVTVGEVEPDHGDGRCISTVVGGLQQRRDFALKTRAMGFLDTVG